MDSNFQVTVTADLSEFYKSIKLAADALTKLDGVVRDIGSASDYASANLGTKLGAAAKEAGVAAQEAAGRLESVASATSKMTSEAGKGRLIAFAFGQVIRDAGFFSQSFGLGLLAISNNVPMLVDQLANGIKVLAPFAGAISLVGSLLTAGLTIWAYSSMAVKENQQSMEEWRKSLDDVTESQLKGRQAALDEVTTLDLLYSASQDASMSLRERAKAVNELQDKYPSYFGNLSDEAVLTGNANNAYKNLRDTLIQVAEARAAQDILVENSKKRLDNEFKISQLESDRVKAAERLNALRSTANQEEGALRSEAISSTDYLLDAEKNLSTIVAKINSLKKDNVAIDKENSAIVTKIKNTTKDIGVVAITGDVSGNKDLKETIDLWEKLNTKLQQVNADPTTSYFDKLTQSIKAHKDALDAAVAKYGPASEEVKYLQDVLSGLNTEMQKQTQTSSVTKLISDFNDKLKDINNTAGATTEQINKMSAEAISDLIIKLQALNGDGALTGTINKLMEMQGKFTEGAVKGTEFGAQIAEMAAGPIAGAFEQMLESGKFSVEGLIQVIGGLIKKLIAAALAALLLSTLLGGLGGGGGKGTGFKDIFGMITGMKMGGGSTPMASGGIVSGPTQALVGEYPGAKSNPEVVAPLDKLQSIIGGASGSSQGGGVLETRISGNDLVILMDRANKTRNNYFG